ncbi:P-loop containing nucleoside triphosphate hydrolase protein, partial [Basidiobolus meristosporus CBS 931.73]
MQDTDLPVHTQPFDPLRFDLSAAISSLVEHITQLESTASLQLLTNRQRHVLDKYRPHQDDIKKGELLDTLAQLLVRPELTLIIAHLFRPLLIDLSARWNRSEILSSYPQISTDFSNFTQVEVVAMAYAKLLNIAPQLKSSAIQFFKQQPSLFERVNTSLSQKKSSAEDPAFTKYLSTLLISAYRLLKTSVRSFAGLFNWTPLFQLINYSDQEIRYYVVLSLSLLLEMSDRETHDSIRSLVGDIYRPGNENLSLLNITEQEELSNERLKMILEACSFIPSEDAPILNASDLSPATVNLCGVLLPRDAQPDTNSESSLVLTSTTVKNLRAIGLALSLGAPVLLEGVTGSGKTALVEEVSHLLGKEDIVKIHLGDQTDSKVLLGTYVSTSTPGSFKWQPGVLTTAVKEGRWVLIEDIDLAPMEVTSVLIPLLETRELFIPSRGERFVAKDGFQLFATRSLMPNGTAVRSSIGNNVMANSLWTRVEVKPLDMNELKDVIEKRYPRLRSISPVIIRVFTTITEIFQDRQYSSITISTMSRFISARDLMKWCRRVDALFSNSKRELFPDDDLPVDDKTREDIFSEAVDCFCSMISSYEGWVMVLEKVGGALGLSKERVHLYANSYVPSMDVTDAAVQVGRVTLRSLADPSSQVKRNSKRVFAQTNHALRLLERIAVGVHLCEPILLVGETGTGKTTVVQYLAELMHQNLIVVNLSQQSDSSDLLGGFKPVDGKIMAIPLKEEFERLFECTFSMKRNAKFLEGARKAFVKKQWKRLITLFKEACKMAKQRLAKRSEKEKAVDSTALTQQWEVFGEQVLQFEARQSQESKLVFSFIEGSLVKAVRKGYWILLDEINLATTETLECLSGLIQDAEGSILLTEKGDTEPIRRHPNFRVFACMNPATDVGKKDLPPGLRNRFTEFYVHPPDARQDDLLTIVKKYLANSSHGDERACMDVTEFYMEAKSLQAQHRLADGANQRPHYSMRTLSRALSYVTQIAPNYGLRRALYEGFSMTFSTLLNKESEVLMRQLIEKYLLKGVKNPRALITQIPRPPAEDGFVQFGHFWLSQGPEVLDEVDHYILTPSVERNLYNLARVVMSNKYPVLLQGPTSAGKTSMIEYLAKRTGHKFIRINNHEHTDLQEYLGTYVSQDGQLTFQEGALVEALRKGYWIVLDELNLAPSDVLEALNRLLDDNRELLIPETQEVVKPHPHFMLFATQNPAGLYGGRKALSRAFRNRFLELHFDDIPEDELETILARRCQIAPSYCKKLVQVYKQLMEHRQRTRIFDGKHGFITLRDMFRWAGREALGYQELAEHGYMILAERTRREEEKAVVKKVIESVMRAKIDEEKLYDCSHLPEFQEFERRVTGTDQSSVAWTKAMKRLFTLVAQCIRFNEPVLLVGDTGCGKTTVCQMLAIAREQELHIVNCHQNTETSDLLGGQRPLRNKSGVLYKKSIGLFEWHDGPLVQSMKSGDLFLLDEISLADDSVLERLNSVLEPHRLLVLAEKGGAHVDELTAHHKFQFLATMNPGGDYGKKELSPALRNRFTEIWVPSVTDEGDLKQIIQERIKDEQVKPFASKMLDFINWYAKALGKDRSIISLRDILSWVEFINEASDKLGAEGSFIHGGSLVLLDGIGSNGSPGTVFSGEALKNFKMECIARLSGQELSSMSTIDLHGISTEIESTPAHFGVAPFFISKGNQTNHKVKFALRAPTTFSNLVRVLRGLQIKKPILLEGSPGVGKTSLISALASASGRNLVRINLSEQTDLMDLFGSDLPVEGGKSGEFAWRDAPFLQAMQSGDWVLLDEINLASQSVLEGLNSCLDHRGSVYIPELDRSFGCAKEFRIFAAQNPIQQGGGRKGLPKSFLNRFTQVYVDQLVKEDLLFICQHSFPNMSIGELEKVIEFNNRMHEETMVRRSFGLKGSPWEFNLRDVFRWLDLLNNDHGLKCITSPAEYLDMIYLKRMRTPEDREYTIKLYNQVFQTTYKRAEHPFYQVNQSHLQVGHSILPRRHNTTEKLTGEQLHLLHTMLGPLEAVMKCVEMNWMAIVTGSSGSGKTSLVRLLAQLTGNVLEEFSMNSGVDTMELLGGFEQVELARYRQKILDGLRHATYRLSKLLLTMQLEDQTKVATQLQQLSNNLFALEQQHTSLDVSKSQSESEFDCSLAEHQISIIRKSIQEFSLTSISNDTVPSESDLSGITSMIDVLKVMQKETVSGKFEWIDGVLIEALEQGHWILIDNANLCNPSILDRLNPLFETNGVLMVNERGLVDGEVKIIQPHKNFRLFMTVDPQNGELSRAMRNRGVEIVLLPQSWSSDDQDIIRLANNMGIPGSKFPLLLRDIHSSTDSYKVPFNTRNYTLLVHMVVELLQRGSSMVAAVKEALSYVDLVSADDNDHASDILGELAEICDGKSESLGSNFYSPANFPYLVNGDFLRKDSALATVVLQSAYLIYLLQQKRCAMEADNAEQIAKLDATIQYASTYFIESTCIADIDLRMQLLNFIANHETLSTAADSMSVEKYLLNETTQHSLASYMEEQKSALTSVAVLWANYKISTEAFELLIRIKRIEHEEKALFSRAERIKISNLNLVQQSFCHDAGRLSESQLTNPVVAQLYPTVITLRQWVLEKLESFHHGVQQTFILAAHQLLDKRDIFWQVVQKSHLDFGELSTAVQWLLK